MVRLDDKDVFTVAEACEILRLDRKTIYQLVADSQLAGVRVGAKYLISRQAIKRFLGDEEWERPAIPNLSPPVKGVGPSGLVCLARTANDSKGVTRLTRGR